MADDRQVIGSGEPLYIDEELVRLPQTTATMSTRKVPVRDTDGSVTGLIGLAFDITERKRMKEALQASEERFRHAIVDSPVPVMIHAEDGSTLLLSRTWMELSGYTAEHIPHARAWLERACPEDAGGALRFTSV